MSDSFETPFRKTYRAVCAAIINLEFVIEQLEEGNYKDAKDIAKVAYSGLSSYRSEFRDEFEKAKENYGKDLKDNAQKDT